MTRADQLRHEVVRRLRDDIERRVVLDHPAAVHDDQLVGQVQRLLHIVRNKKHRLVGALLQSQELLLQPRAGDGIYGAERFIHQQDVRVSGQRAGDAHALLLSARQLRRIAAAIFSGGQAHHVHQLLHTLLHAAGLPAEDRGDRGDVLRHGPVRKEADVLNHVADAPAQIVDGQRLHILPFHNHLSP